MAQALLKLGHSVTVATRRYGDSPSNFTEDGIKVRRIMSWAARRKIGYLGLDVYEEEEQIFFEDRSGLILSDDVFAPLLTFQM